MMTLVGKNEYDIKEKEQRIVPARSLPCPSLQYESIPVPGETLEIAFDLLFEEILRINKN